MRFGSHDKEVPFLTIIKFAQPVYQGFHETSHAARSAGPGVSGNRDFQFGSIRR
jgi:hypothetical protein